MTLSQGTSSSRLPVLVVGASGQLARSLMAAAPRYDALDVTFHGRPSLDLLQGSSIAKAFETAQPAWAINAAAYTAVDRAESEPEAAFAVNREGAGAVAAAAARAGIPIIHVSTDYVFDGRKACAYVETDPTAPLGVYGRSKLEGEERVAAANSQHIILRTSWVYSEYGNNFVKTMLRLASERPELRVVADQHGNPTYAGDLATVILDIIQQAAHSDVRPAWGIYHAAGNGHTTWHEFALHIVRESEKYGRKAVPVIAIATRDFPTPAQRPANSMLECSKLKAQFNLEFPFWRDGVSRCVAALCGDSVEANDVETN
jgi:dTDP-4-dehydrorhamnose reductase